MYRNKRIICCLINIQGFCNKSLCYSVITCGPPPELPNGNYNPRQTNRYAFMQQVDYWCMSGYMMVGSPWRTCMESGLWTSDDQECQDINECGNPDQCGPMANCRNLEPGFECWCEEGYNLVRNDCESKIFNVEYHICLFSVKIIYLKMHFLAKDPLSSKMYTEFDYEF